MIRTQLILQGRVTWTMMNEAERAWIAAREREIASREAVNSRGY